MENTDTCEQWCIWLQENLWTNHHWAKPCVPDIDTRRRRLQLELERLQDLRNTVPTREHPSNSVPLAVELLDIRRVANKITLSFDWPLVVLLHTMSLAIYYIGIFLHLGLLGFASSLLLASWLDFIMVASEFLSSAHLDRISKGSSKTVPRRPFHGGMKQKSSSFPF